MLVWAGAALSVLPLHAQNLAKLAEGNYVNLAGVASGLEMDSAWVEPNRAFRITSSQGARIDFIAGSREIGINGTKVFLGEPVLRDRKQLYVSLIDLETTLRPILKPSTRIPAGPVRTIVIDPGHGGRDPGTRNAALGLREKELTLAVAFRLRDLLEGQGYRVVLTRSDDTFVALPNRALVAAAEKADLFVSIHFNAVDNPAVEGTEIYVLTPRTHRSTGQAEGAGSDLLSNTGNGHDHWNALLGFLVQRQLLRDLGTFDRGLKRARFQVLREADCPTVLVEAGYVSNPAEAAGIATPQYQERLAHSLAIAINIYRQATERISAAGR